MLRTLQLASKYAKTRTFDRSVNQKVDRGRSKADHGRSRETRREGARRRGQSGMRNGEPFCLSYSGGRRRK